MDHDVSPTNGAETMTMLTDEQLKAIQHRLRATIALCLSIKDIPTLIAHIEHQICQRSQCGETDTL